MINRIEKGILVNFFGESLLTHLPPAVEDSVNLMGETRFHFKLN